METTPFVKVILVIFVMVILQLATHLTGARVTRKRGALVVKPATEGFVTIANAWARNDSLNDMETRGVGTTIKDDRLGDLRWAVADKNTDDTTAKELMTPIDIMATKTRGSVNEGDYSTGAMQLLHGDNKKM